MTQLILFNVFNGLIVGAFYALMALGLSLILNLSGVINFAHGGFLALGAYIAYTLMPYVGFWGALLIAPFLTAFIGLIVERLLIRRLYGRDPLYSLLLTFGLAYVLEDGSRYIWGAQSVPFPIPEALTTPLSHGVLLPHRLPAVHGGLVAVAVAALFYILNRTRLGMRIRAGTIGSRDRLRARRERAASCATSTSASASTSPGSPACSPPACWDCSRPSAPRSSCPASSPSSWAAWAACRARCWAAC